MVRLSSIVSLALWGLSAAATPCISCKGENAVSAKCRPREVAHHREYFYVGGREVPSPPGVMIVDQLYVEKLTPAAGARDPDAKPIVFIHGGGTSGVSWLNTPDGRPGWASNFLGKGHVVYIIDYTAVGRSSANNFADVQMVSAMTSMIIEMGFTAPAVYNTYPQSQHHTQWPGTGRAGDPTFDLFHKSFIPINNNFVTFENAMRASGCELLRLIGDKSYLVSHSMGSRGTILMANDCPEYIAGNINIEGSTIPFWRFNEMGPGGSPTNAWGFTNTPLSYDPPVSDPSELETVTVGNETLALRSCVRQREPARQLPNIASVPFLMVTGEASVHITYDHCIIDYLEQVGGSPEWIKLSEIGIKGNGHFLHMEKNSDEIADVVSEWIEKTEGA